MPSAQQLLIFISAFAPGDEGAIHAYRLDADSGTLTEVHRHADITEPFFLALSPTGIFSIRSIARMSSAGNRMRKLPPTRLSATTAN